MVSTESFCSLLNLLQYLFVQYNYFTRKKRLNLFQCLAPCFWQEEEEYDPAYDCQTTIEVECPVPGQPIGQEQEGHGNDKVECPVSTGRNGITD